VGDQAVKTYAVITAKDEAVTIGPLVSALISQGMSVIVVNDGSKDKTAPLAIKAGARYIVDHTESQGIAKSLLEAWQAALDQGADRVVQIDAGGSHDPLEAFGLLLMQDVYDYDVVIGSRFCEGAHYTGRPWRAFLSRLSALLMNFVAHSHLTDWTSGYRVFSRAAVESLLQHKYYATMHAWQMEVLAWALLDKLTICEYPITYTAGRSSMKWKLIDEAIMVWLWRMHK
jgi:dolichol-phosphate mannosyltransferase